MPDADLALASPPAVAGPPAMRPSPEPPALASAARLAHARAALAEATSAAVEAAARIGRLGEFRATVARLEAELKAMDDKLAADLAAWVETREGERPEAPGRDDLVERLAQAMLEAQAAERAAAALRVDEQQLQAAAARAAAAVEAAAVSVVLAEHAALIDECARHRAAYVTAYAELGALEAFFRERAEACRVSSNDAGHRSWHARANALTPLVAPLRLDGREPLKALGAAVAGWRARLSELQREPAQ